MNHQLLARETTTRLVVEALERFGPLTEREIGTMLDEPFQVTGAILNRLLLYGRVRVTRTADCRTVMFAARRDTR